MEREADCGEGSPAAADVVVVVNGGGSGGGGTQQLAHLLVLYNDALSCYALSEGASDCVHNLFF